MVILRKTVVLLETWFRTLAYSSIASSFYRYTVSIFTLIMSYEMQIYNPNKKVFFAGMKQKRGKTAVSKRGSIIQVIFLFIL